MTLNEHITIPLPGQVELLPDSRFSERYQGNISYLKHLHDHSGEFMLEAFASRHYSPGKLLERIWDGEYAGKWLDAATQAALNSDDQGFIAMVDGFAAKLRGYQQSNGFMGEPLPTDRELNAWETGWNVWVQWTCLIGLLTHYELQNEPRSLACATRIGDWIMQTYHPVDSNEASFIAQGHGFTNVAVINQMMRLYQHTGNEALCDFVEGVIQYFEPLRNMMETGQPHIAHPYMLGAVLTGMVDLAVARNDQDSFDIIVGIWRALVNIHQFPTGSLGENENLYEGPLVDNPDGKLQETCATTEWIFLTQRLFEITGDAEFAEALEKTAYNALLGAQSDDGMKWCYYTPLRHSKHFFHGPTRCCFWSGPRGIVRIPSMIYASRNNEIYVNIFDSSTATLNTPDGNVNLRQQSEFPENGTSRIELSASADWAGTLRVRIPTWCENYTITHDQQVYEHSPLDGYASIEIKGADNYIVEVNFEIPLSKVLLSEDNYALKRGAEVLSIDLRDNNDTWIGTSDLISIPDEIEIHPTIQKDPWPGFKQTPKRRRYSIRLNDRRTTEGMDFIFTPYADAGNDGAAFRTVFPLTQTSD
ncbi:MAG TPA: hypothetical protein DCM54_05160 [Gammaproteobacteria bacterium]|nr:hypothetical protein [Gammaproteobacteria bacterium]